MLLTSEPPNPWGGCSLALCGSFHFGICHLVLTFHVDYQLLPTQPFTDLHLLQTISFVNVTFLFTPSSLSDVVISLQTLTIAFNMLDKLRSVYKTSVISYHSRFGLRISNQALKFSSSSKCYLMLLGVSS